MIKTRIASTTEPTNDSQKDEQRLDMLWNLVFLVVSSNRPQHIKSSTVRLLTKIANFVNELLSCSRTYNNTTINVTIYKQSMEFNNQQSETKTFYELQQRWFHTCTPNNRISNKYII